MRLHESDYIRLWYIAGLVQLDASENPLEETGSKEFSHFSVKAALDLLAKLKNISTNEGSSVSIPPDDKTIFEGLTKVHKRFVKLLAKYEIVHPQKAENIAKLAEQTFTDAHVKWSHELSVVIEEKGEITSAQVEQESFGLFQSIPSAVDFYCNFLNIINLYDLIALLKRHPDIPLGRWILYNFQLLFNIGYVVKEKANYDYAFLNSAVGMSLHWLKKCLENREQAFTFEVAQVASPAGNALEEYLQEMCEIYCCCNRIHALAQEEEEKRKQTNKKISATKKSKSDATTRQRNESIRQAIAELKNSEKCKQHAACEKYFYENEKELKEKGIKSVKYLENICSGHDPNKHRREFNSGEKIQAAFTGAEWRAFLKAYEEWRKSKSEDQSASEVPEK